MRYMVGLAVAGLLLAGCSSSKDGDSQDGKASPKPAKTSATAPAELPKLSEEWVPKLDKATGKPDICKTVGSKGCVDHLNRMTVLVYDLEDAIAAADAKLLYPRSMDDIRKVTRAADGYVDDGCEGSTELTLGNSPCAEHAAGILVGPALLSLDLTTDESRAATGG